MSAPALTNYQSGMGVVTGDNLNTFAQTCDNVAQLRGLIGIAGLSVITRGQIAPGDGNGGYYWWDAVSTATDNGLTVIKPTGGASMGRWTSITLGASVIISGGGFTVLSVALVTIPAGSFVTFTSSGVVLAEANSPSTPAQGFCLAGASTGNTVAVSFAGANIAVTVSAFAAQVWLSDTAAGGYQTTPPSTSGHIIQALGPAIPGVGILFTPQITVQL